MTFARFALKLPHPLSAFLLLSFPRNSMKSVVVFSYVTRTGLTFSDIYLSLSLHLSDRHCASEISCRKTTPKKPKNTFKIPNESDTQRPKLLIAPRCRSAWSAPPSSATSSGPTSSENRDDKSCSSVVWCDQMWSIGRIKPQIPTCSTISMYNSFLAAYHSRCSQKWVKCRRKRVGIRVFTRPKCQSTPQIVYKVAICPRGNLPYTRSPL